METFGSWTSFLQPKLVLTSKNCLAVRVTLVHLSPAIGKCRITCFFFFNVGHTTRIASEISPWNFNVSPPYRSIKTGNHLHQGNSHPPADMDLPSEDLYCAVPPRWPFAICPLPSCVHSCYVLPYHLLQKSMVMLLVYFRTWWHLSKNQWQKDFRSENPIDDAALKQWSNWMVFQYSSHFS